MTRKRPGGSAPSRPQRLGLQTVTDISTTDRATEIERLATLEPVDYEASRLSAAEQLKVRASVLDNLVSKARRKLGLNSKNDDGNGRAVRFVDVWSWPETVDGDTLAVTLGCVIKTYAVLSDAAADAIALWILHTWLIDKLTVSPRLAVTSPTKGCGKTTILRLLHQLCRRPKRSGSISPPALFRVVEKYRPTILLDETEKYVEHGGDLHALLNEGHAKGGSVMRVLGEKLELREFALFCAIAFARNGRIPDDLEQRSIVIEMQRRRPDEPLGELRDGNSVLQELARKCSRWADDNADIASDSNPDMAGLINRDRDNWLPLFAIADTIGADWPERVREAAAVLAPRETQSTGPLLLADIRAVFDAKATDRIASTDLCDALAEMEGRSWAEFGKARKPITKNQLARLLADFHVRPDTIRFGTKPSKGYYRHLFDEAWQRYLPQGEAEPLHRNNASAADTSAPFRTVTQSEDVTVEKDEKSNNDGLCYGVTVEIPDKAPPRARDDEPGLSWRAVDAIASQVSDWAHDRSHSGKGDTDIDQLRAEVGRRLEEAGLFKDAIEFEAERVIGCLFETEEARRHNGAAS